MPPSSLQLACAALATLALTSAEPPARPHHRVARHAFFRIGCKGIYDSAHFAELDRLCDDCYVLFKEAILYNECRQKCFTSKFFKGCVEALHETNKLDRFKEFLMMMQGGDYDSYWEDDSSSTK